MALDPSILNAFNAWKTKFLGGAPAAPATPSFTYNQQGTPVSLSGGRIPAYLRPPSMPQASSAPPPNTLSSAMSQWSSPLGGQAFKPVNSAASLPSWAQPATPSSSGGLMALQMPTFINSLSDAFKMNPQDRLRAVSNTIGHVPGGALQSSYVMNPETLARLMDPMQMTLGANMFSPSGGSATDYLGLRNQYHDPSMPAQQEVISNDTALLRRMGISDPVSEALFRTYGREGAPLGQVQTHAPNSMMDWALYDQQQSSMYNPLNLTGGGGGRFENTPPPGYMPERRTPLDAMGNPGTARRGGVTGRPTYTRPVEEPTSYDPLHGGAIPPDDYTGMVLRGGR